MVDVTLEKPSAGDSLRVARYVYALRKHSGRELLAFHWHPESRSPVAFPHLRVSAALRGTTPSGEAAILPLDKIHLPTGFVSVSDVVRLLVAELGVAPVVGGWQGRLERAGPMLPAFPS